MATLLIADHDNTLINDATRKALSAAQQMGGSVQVLVAGHEAQRAAEAASRLDGVEKILLADAVFYGHGLAEPVADLIVALAPSFDAIVAPSTAFGKNILPRVAALLDVMQVSDVIRVLAPDTFERPIYAGNALQTVQVIDAKKVLTIRTASFDAAADGSAAPIELLSDRGDTGISTFVEETVVKSTRPELSSAKTIVSGGRALGSPEHFTQFIEPVADALGAAMGASRAAVDAGYAPNDWQVGQTGKVVAPDLYVAVGISGAIQHLAGMKDSKVIVAINKDPDAPIFQIADYGLVGDLFEIMPELQKALNASAS
ncbi:MULTISPECIES: electron transfer flavoprotein subunit alpha/FixB family protein [unclassified Xanthobacter]|uniref:electron transfer flavoprotein subunit alpha/FixB family protein n=1 Tax=unclassified Xanthobacter TaxID=2623496 RepID=UPI001EDFE04B|nr:MULTISPECIES: FAD-binding protein [unclassified Xanthobacter]